MLRRLLLTLLIACLAVPAMAAGCAQPVATHQASAGNHGHHPAPAPDAPAASHDCIGCIAPLHGLGRMAFPQPVPQSLSSEHVASLDSRSLIPEPPPPRRSI